MVSFPLNIIKRGIYMLEFRRVKYACYFTNIAQAAVANLTPLLFVTLRGMYGISYSLLGLLVLINFCTQLIIDLVFSFYAHKFKIAQTVKMTPVLTVIGLVLFSLAPNIFPNHVYIGIVLGTIIFSASGGLAEVLISPVINAIPFPNPEREMSKLHSIYAWGVVLVVAVSTAFLKIFGGANWQIISLIWAVIPLTSALLFTNAKMPDLEVGEEDKGNSSKMLRSPRLLLCLFCIFLGGASECTMAQWSSGYLEQALRIDKMWGDLLGVAMFAVFLGMGRSLYAKFGKNVERVLFFGSLGAAFCYFLAALSPYPAVSLVACAFTGFCVSMLWPGSLIAASGAFPSAGVVLFALMAAAGDLGGSVGPQIVGSITDFAMNYPAVINAASQTGMTVEQIGLKCGMLAASVFPIIGTFMFGILWKIRKK